MVREESETITAPTNGVENGSKKTDTPAKTDQQDSIIASLKAEHHAKLIELTREVNRLREENASLKQQQQQQRKEQKRTPLIVSQATRLKWGAETFIEGNSTDMEMYDSYQEWYRGMSETMANEVSYTCSKYLFVRTEFGKRHDHIFFISKSGKSFIKRQDMVVIDALNDGWGHNQIASIMALHPVDPVKSLEFEYSCKGDDFNQWSVRDVAEDIYGSNKSLLICCMLNR